jgi:DNA-binding NarL/FixJ family response regulator
MQKKILLVEDDNLLRIGLKSMIDMHGEYIVESNVSTGLEALRLFMNKQSDVILLDLRLPDIPGTDVLKKIKETNPSTKVIILSAHDDNDLIFETLECGADAFILKGANPEEVFLAIQYALMDDLFISPKLAKIIVKDYLFINRQRKSLPPLHNLTNREKEIVHYIVDGKKSKEIAEQLYISVKTVNKHRSNILGKLGISSSNELRRGSMHLLNELKLS